MVGLTHTKSEEELKEDIVDFDDKEKELTLVNWSSDKEINDKRNQEAGESNNSELGGKASHEELEIVIKDYDEVDKDIAITKLISSDTSGKAKEKEVNTVVSDDEVKNNDTSAVAVGGKNVSLFQQVKIQFCFDDFTYSFVFCFIPSIMDFWTDFSFGASFATEKESLAAGVVYAIIILPSCQLLVDVLFKLFWARMSHILALLCCTVILLAYWATFFIIFLTGPLHCGARWQLTVCKRSKCKDHVKAYLNI